MKNDFTEVMSKKTDEELIQVITRDRQKYQELAIESAEHEITFRNIDVSQFQDVIVEAYTKKEEEGIVGANTVGSIVRFVHFIVDIIAFLVVYAIIGTLFQFAFSIEGNEYILLFWFLMLLSFVLYFSVMEFKFQKTLGKFITKTKVVTLKGEKPSINAIMRRTFCRLIPFDRLSFLFMKDGIHDGLSKTRVVKE
ncbi:MAG: putative RDD family membrane protein YckC [Flavobacterium sp.]|jgi:uncharacterized RDD family membrane protein YckC